MSSKLLVRRFLAVSTVCLAIVAVFTGCETVTLVEAVPVAVVVAEPEMPDINGVWEKALDDGKFRAVISDGAFLGVLLNERRYGGIGGIVVARCSQSPTRISCSITQFRDIPEDPPIGHTFSFAYEVNEDGTMTASQAYDDGDYMSGTWKPVEKW